ncbi:MAG TPA: ubiquinol-cytochrome C reductase, partial [Nocardioides sp.]
MSDNHTPVPADEPGRSPEHRADVASVDDPGLPPHQWRPTDVDERAEKRAERQVAMFFGLSMLCALLFVVAYFTLEVGDEWDTFLGLGASTLALGTALGFALLFIGIGVIQWARKLMGDHEIVEMRHPAASSEDDRAATLEALATGTEESGIGRRPLVRNTLLGAVGLL